jgi:hypothetical protein
MVVQVGANFGDDTRYYWYQPVDATKREPDDEEDDQEGG